MADRWYDAAYADSSATLRLHVYTVGSNASSNYTVERADLWMRVNANWGYYNNYGTSVYIGINGNNTTRTVNFDARVSAGTQLLLIGTWDTTVWHNGNGDASIGVSCSHATGVGLGTASGSWTYDCDHIPRYANFTQHYISARSINTATVYWNADVTCAYVQYSLNGGAWQDCNGGNTYVISNLNPNTTYYIRTRIKRDDSGPWTESSNISITTHDIAKISTYDSILKIGNNLNMKYSNPANAKVEAGIFKVDGNTAIINYKEYDNNGIYNITESEMKELYKQLKNSNSYTARLYIRTTQNSKTYLNYVEIKIQATGNIKTAYIKNEDIIKQAKVFIKVDGIVKKAVVWIKRKGKVMRCI